MKVGHIVAITLAVVLSAASLFAHNGKTHIEGTVTAIDANQIIVKEKKGRSISIRINPDTIYQRAGSGAPATPADIKVGDHVIVETFGMPGGEQTALEIHFSAPPEVDEHKERGHLHGEQQ